MLHHLSGEKGTGDNERRDTGKSEKVQEAAAMSLQIKVYSDYV
jgi:hypothetical protein